MTTTETPAPEAPEEHTDERPALEAPQTPFWQRPNVERYLVPVVLPVAIVVGLVMFVINISRIFLAGHGEVPVVVGTLITATILIGAAILSAAPRARSSSIALVTAGFVGSIVLAGWLSLGHAEPEGEGGEELAAEGGFAEELTFSTEGVRFVPSEANAPTGIVRITMTSGSGTHTLVFADAATLFPGIETPATGDTDFARAFFGEPGDYDFYCTVPGHREAGMEGVVTVEGEPTTLDAALAAVEGEGGEGAAEEPAA